MILVINPNPALDRALDLPDFEAGKSYHIPKVLEFAGGKGFNFARALKTLGGEPFVLSFLAGHIGKAVAALAETEGIAAAAHWFNGETRHGLHIVDPARQRVTELYEIGPTPSPSDWDLFGQMVARYISQAEAIAVCGSFPPGTPDNCLHRLVEQAHAAQIPIWIDTTGAQLAAALPARPTLIKINVQEAGQLLDSPARTAKDALALAAGLRVRGALSAVVTLGQVGALGIDADGALIQWASALVNSISPVGSGDSLFAGIAASLVAGRPLSEAVRFGVAAGSANTLHTGAGVFRREQVEALAGKIHELTL